MRHLISVLVLTMVSACLGCNKEMRLEGTVKVTGTVTFQGKPLEGASVAFSPIDMGRAASGKTDATGRFQLTSLKADDGAMPGKYNVSVSKVEVENAMTADEAMKWFKEHSGPPPGGNIKNALPDKYKDVKTSGLTAEVTEGGANDFTFSLE